MGAGAIPALVELLEEGFGLAAGALRNLAGIDAYKVLII